MRRMSEPEPPWFTNVVHASVGFRPLCGAPVDYARVVFSDHWSIVNCLACHRARPDGEESSNE